MHGVRRGDMIESGAGRQGETANTSCADSCTMILGIEQSMTEQVEIGGVVLHLNQPDDSAGEWIGQREILMQLLACWLVIDEKDLPLAPRIVGTPGIGKTTLAISAGRTRKQDLYIYQ